jgi:hypothetical protein
MVSGQVMAYRRYPAIAWFGTCCCSAQLRLPGSEAALSAVKYASHCMNAALQSAVPQCFEGMHLVVLPTGTHGITGTVSMNRSLGYTNLARST